MGNTVPKPRRTCHKAGTNAAGTEGKRSGGASSAGTRVTVKVLMRRKDAEALVARLHAQSARERKARMAELKRQLRASPATSSSCRGDAWRPRLAPVQENQW